MRDRNHGRGFTIAELLIVIVVIGILAAIVVVAYSNLRANATDTRMRTGVSQIEKAIYMWYAEKNEQLRGGWSSTTTVADGNCADGTGGWVASGYYPCSLEDILVSQQLIPSGLIKKLPPNKQYSDSHGGLSMMFYPCSGATGRYALYWHLLSPSAEETANLTSVEAAGCPAYPRTSYGMKAAKLITLN